MFKIKKRFKILLSSLFLLVIISIVGCERNGVIIDEVNSIDIYNGAVAVENNNEYKIYNKINDTYEKVDTNYLISSYNLNNKSFIFNKDGKIKINYKGKDIDIEDNKNIISPKLSTMGEYLLYFIKDEYLELKIKDLDKNEYVNFKSNVFISGDLVEWLSEDSLIYYGIDENKNNGVFLYDLKKQEEKLLYKLENGFLEYIKVFDNLTIFTQSNFSKERSIKIINADGKIIEEINNVEEVNDIQYTKDGLFILGKFKDNTYSIYKYQNGNLKRIVYDFPKIINLEKGLSKDENDNILFIGNDEINDEKVYMYDNESITLLSITDGSYFFIDVR